MKNSIVIIGMGELGGVFAKGFLKLGLPVVPVIRSMDVNETARQYPDPRLILVAVAENDYHPLMASLPKAWKNKIALLQNELLPRDWQGYGVEDPTVATIWFEKKKGQDVIVLLPSKAYGPEAPLLTDALATTDIPMEIVANQEQLAFELALKNLFVFTINLVGLKVGGVTGDLWANHQTLTANIAHEVIAVQQALLNQELPQDLLTERFIAALDADPHHNCSGRSAPERLTRLLGAAKIAKIATPTIKEINA